MKIEQVNIKIADIVNGYIYDEENGIYAYNNLLNVRPPYQRNFVYDDEKRNAVIETIIKGFPLNVMYWAKNTNGTFEVIDGQQRTISFCDYVKSKFSIVIDGKTHYFHTLPVDKQNDILNYEIMVYICEGTESEKLEWFEVINIAGEKLTRQELRNAIYNGEWTTDAKRYFSKNGCPAFKMYSGYFSGTAIRQEYLETAIKWIASRDGYTIDEYMAKHKNDKSATLLWQYVQAVMNWTQGTFTVYRKEMKGIEWGLLYNQYGNNEYDPKELEKKVSALMVDEDISNHKGVYEYILDGKEKHLNIRAFDNRMKRLAYEKQKGICAKCLKHFEIDEMEADHITPWHLGGPTTADNCQMLCKECNRRKSGK